MKFVDFEARQKKRLLSRKWQGYDNGKNRKESASTELLKTMDNREVALDNNSQITQRLV